MVHSYDLKKTVWALNFFALIKTLFLKCLKQKEIINLIFTTILLTSINFSRSTKERRGEIVQKFKGQVYNMMRKNNELGSSVIEFLYNDYCNKDQRHQLLREMLGKVYIMHPVRFQLFFG